MRKIRKLGGRAVDANEVFFDNYTIPGDSLIGKEGQGFKIILHGMNAERCLLAGEALGLGYAALNRAAQYARDRVVFGRPIGQNQVRSPSLLLPLLAYSALAPPISFRSLGNSSHKYLGNADSSV